MVPHQHFISQPGEKLVPNQYISQPGEKSVSYQHFINQPVGKLKNVYQCLTLQCAFSFRRPSNGYMEKAFQLLRDKKVIRAPDSTPTTRWVASDT